jgi:hypothetical protein
LRSPISKEVDLGDFVADSLVDVGNEVPDDGGPQVTHVKRFGNVGRTGKTRNNEFLKMKIRLYSDREKKKRRHR